MLWWLGKSMFPGGRSSWISKMTTQSEMKILALLIMTEERTKPLICDMWGIGNFPLGLEISFRKSGK